MSSRRSRFALVPLSVVLAIAVVLAGGEAASRVFWRCWRGVPLGDPGRVLYAYYPDLAVVDRLRPAHDDGFYDVLLLGGSVLHPDWTPIERKLSTELKR